MKFKIIEKQYVSKKDNQEKKFLSFFLDINGIDFELCPKGDMSVIRILNQFLEKQEEIEQMRIMGLTEVEFNA